MKILNRIKAFFSYIPSYFCYFLDKCKIFLSEIGQNIQKLRDLKNSNIQIGLYHFYHHNFNDAVMRFKFVHKFLDKGNKKALYYLGWIYFIKKDYIKAINHLKASSDGDEVKLQEFIKNMPNISVIPKGINKVLRDLAAFNFEKRFIDKTQNIIQDVITLLMDVVVDLPDEYKILDIGSNRGLLGHEIKRRMPDKCLLFGVESSEIMLREQQNFIDNQKIYEEVKCDYISDFIQNNNEKYDIILSLSALSYSSKMHDIFNNLYKSINHGGYLALVVASDTNTRFSKDKLEFVYDIDYILDEMQKHGFYINVTQEILLENKNRYYIVIANKNKNYSELG